MSHCHVLGHSKNYLGEILIGQIPPEYIQYRPIKYPLNKHFFSFRAIREIFFYPFKRKRCLQQESWKGHHDGALFESNSAEEAMPSKMFSCPLRFKNFLDGGGRVIGVDYFGCIKNQ